MLHPFSMILIRIFFVLCVDSELRVQSVQQNTENTKNLKTLIRNMDVLTYVRTPVFDDMGLLVFGQDICRTKYTSSGPARLSTLLTPTQDPHLQKI